MNTIIGLGRYIFPAIFIIFGLFHFMNGEGMAGMVPSFLPGATFFVYFTGLCLVAAGVSMYMGKYDKLAATLLGILLLIFVLTIWLPQVGGDDQGAAQMAMSALLKDLGLAAASWIYAGNVARDNSVVG